MDLYTLVIIVRMGFILIKIKENVPHANVTVSNVIQQDVSNVMLIM